MTNLDPRAPQLTVAVDNGDLVVTAVWRMPLAGPLHFGRNSLKLSKGQYKERFLGIGEITVPSPYIGRQSMAKGGHAGLSRALEADILSNPREKREGEKDTSAPTGTIVPGL